MNVICIDKDLLDLEIFKKKECYEVEKIKQCVNCKAYKIKGKDNFYSEHMFKKIQDGKNKETK